MISFQANFAYQRIFSIHEQFPVYNIKVKLISTYIQYQNYNWIENMTQREIIANVYKY